MNMKHLLFTPILLVLVSFGLSLSAQNIDLPVTNKLVPHDIYFEGNNEITVNLKGLVVGDTYHVYLVQDKYNPPVALSSLPNDIAQQSNTYLMGTVGAGVISFCLDALAPKLNSISLVVGKNLPPSLLNNREKLAGDTLEVEENNDIDFLLNTVFRKDTCFALFPGSIRGGRRIRADGTFLGQTGIFRNGAPSIGIDSGIIITTGWVQNAPGPNTPAASQNGPVDFFTTMNGIDEDADSLLPPGVDIYDLAILEFDFIPTTDTISFNYIFFSEEYCAVLQGNVANDAFGFMLTGPDGVTVNIARLPVSDDIVSPATLNPGTVDAASFRNNTTPAFDNPCPGPPADPASLTGIGYDGFSTVLTARGAVTPCARHTLKIVVLDADNALSDSGVLLEAGSFLAGLVNKPEPNTTAQVDVLQPVEGCDTAIIKFTRRTLDEPFINRPLLVKYNIIPFFGAGATEATRTEDPGNTAGADYLLPASPFVIPGGDTSAVLSIPILADADFGEGLEAFIIRYDGTCDCSENADTFWIQDAVNYTVDIGPDLTLCAGNDVELTATPTGGNGNYTFSWPNLADTNRVTYTTTGRDTTIIVNVTDECGLMGTGSVDILAPDFSATTVGDYSLCSNPTADVLVDVGGLGTGPFIITLWVDSNNVVTSTDYQVTGDTTFLFEIDADVTVSSITDLSGCGGAVSQDTARVRSADVLFTDVVELAVCDQPVGSIRINTNDGNNNFTFDWLDDPSETTGTRTMLLPGTYEVSIAPVIDPACARIVRYDLRSPAALEIDTFNYTIPTCAGETITLAPIVVGGTGDYTFVWPDSMTTDSLLTIVTQPGLNIYPVIVTDSCGREASGSVVLNLPVFNVDMSGRYSLCNTGAVTIPYTISGPADTYSVEIQIDSAGISRTRILARPPGVSSLTFDYPADITIIGITNGDGCAGDTIMGTASVADPDIRFNVQVDSVTCNTGNDGQITLTDPANVPVTFTWDDAGPATAIRTGLSAGSYTVTITDAADGTCFRDTTILIEEPMALSVSLIRGTATCPFEPDTLGPLVMGGTAPYSYSWPDSMATDSSLAIVTLPGTNTYQVEITDACGEMAFAFVSYTFENVQASISGTFGVCNAPFFVDVPVTFSGSTGYTFTLRENGIERTLVVTGDTTLRYTTATTIELLEVFGADGCAGRASGTARVIDADFVVTNAGNNVNCRGGNDGALDLTVNGDPSAYTYAWERAGLSGPNPTGLSADTFRVRITDNSPSACFFDTFFVVTEPELLTLSVNNTPVTCQNELSTLIPTVGGGTPPYSYSWDNATGTDSLYQVTTVGGSTSYPLVVTDACGVSLRDTVRIVLSDTRATTAGNFSVCNAPFNTNVPIILTGTGPFTFVVRENMVDRTIVATGDTSLNYTAETTVQLISVMGADGCPGVAGGIANVTDGDFNVVPTVTDVLCQGQATGAISVVVNGNNAAYSFTWDTPGLSGPDVSGLRAGTYNLMVTDPTPFACTWDTTFTILEPASAITLSADSIRDLTCELSGYASAVYSGGTGQLSYRWSNGTATSELGEADPGTYTLSVTDENMCQVTQLFNIQDRRTVVFAAISASADSLSCRLTSINLSAQQNTFVVDYQWEDSAGNDLGTNRQLMVSMTGRYFVRVTNPANGCTAIDSIDIGRSDNLLNLELPTQYEINCTNSTVDLTVSHPGYTDPVDYEWRLNGSVVGTAATLPNTSTTGNYEVAVTRRDNGCPTTVQTSVIIDRADPVVSVPAPSVSSTCREPEVLIGVVANGPYRFEWVTPNGMIIGSTNEATALAGGAGTYSVLITDTLNGCTTTESISVVLNGSTLAPNAGTDQPLICNGSGTVLNGSASPRLNGTEVRWYGPAGDVIGEGLQTFTFEEGQHILEVIHPVSGCSSFDTVQVFSEAATSVSYSLQQPPCPEVGGRLFVTDVVGLNGPFTYSSPTGETEPFGFGLRGLRVGTNVLVVTDQFGCELRDTFQIFEGGEFTGTAEDVVIRLGDDAVLGINTNRTDGELANWTWGNISDTLTCLTCPDPVVASPLETFIATVTVTDTNGCVLTMRQNVIVDEEDLIYMPTAFSPANADGINDVYTVFGNAEFVSNINFLRIFDRWGNQVFGNIDFPVNDPNEGWAGVSPGGQYAPSAVYSYVVSYERWDGETEVRSGSFTLVR